MRSVACGYYMLAGIDLGSYFVSFSVHTCITFMRCPSFALADLPCFPISEMDRHAKCCTLIYAHPHTRARALAWARIGFSFVECVVATSVCCRALITAKSHVPSRTYVHICTLSSGSRARLLLPLRWNTHKRWQFTFFFFASEFFFCDRLFIRIYYFHACFVSHTIDVVAAEPARESSDQKSLSWESAKGAHQTVNPIGEAISRPANAHFLQFEWNGVCIWDESKVQMYAKWNRMRNSYQMGILRVHFSGDAERRSQRPTTRIRNIFARSASYRRHLRTMCSLLNYVFYLIYYISLHSSDADHPRHQLQMLEL